MKNEKELLECFEAGMNLGQCSEMLMLSESMLLERARQLNFIYNSQTEKWVKETSQLHEKMEVEKEILLLKDRLQVLEKNYLPTTSVIETCSGKGEALNILKELELLHGPYRLRTKSLNSKPQLAARVDPDTRQKFEIFCDSQNILKGDILTAFIEYSLRNLETPFQEKKINL